MQQVLKDILSVKGLIMLIALVALGLSIAAVVRGCGDDFGDVCGRIKNNKLDTTGCKIKDKNVECDGETDCSYLPGSPSPFDGKPTYDCKCQISDNLNNTTCTVEGQPCQESSECCRQDSEGKTYNPELTCYENSCLQKKSCRTIGKPCQKPHDCCSHYCAPPGDGNGRLCGLAETDEDEQHYYPSKNEGKDQTTAGHRRTAKQPTSLGFVGDSHTWAPGSKTSAVVNTTPPPPPPSSDGGFPEWATITLSSVGGVLLLGLVIYLLMIMKHGNKLM